MVHQLTRPLVPIGMKNGYAKLESMEVLVKDAVLHGPSDERLCSDPEEEVVGTHLDHTSMKLTANVIQKPNSPGFRNVAEEFIQESKGVMLPLTGCGHVHQE